MIKYNDRTARATFEFNEETLQGFVNLCEREGIDAVFAIDQILMFDEEKSLFILQNPWLLGLVKDIHKSNKVFSGQDPQAARDEAVNYLHNLAEVIESYDDITYLTMFDLRALIQAVDFASIIRATGYKISLYAVGTFLELDELQMLVASQFATSEEILEKEKRLLEQYKR